MTEASPLTGRLLVATPALTDPNFDRAVVLLLDHDEEGTLGVVLNRPTQIEVSAVLESWAELAGPPPVVFQGGPVSLDSALALAVLPGANGEGASAGVVSGEGETKKTGAHPEGELPGELPTSEVLGWRRVHGAIGLVDLDAPPELLAAELGSLRVFAGYAGWAPGQLENELVEGAWYVVECEPGDVSSPEPDRLWRAVLRRQRSELAMVATYPDDPTMN